MLGVDYIYTNLVRKDLNENRKIYEAKCLHCGKGFKNHRSLRKHLKSCLVIENQQTITDFLKSYYAPPVEKMTLTSFQENLIEFFVSTNISIQSVESPVTKKIFESLGVKKDDIPTAEVFRRMLQCYANKIKEQNLKLFKNKSVCLIIDGTTSWNQSLYEFAIYYPGVVRHFGLFEINPADAQNLKNVIDSICQKLNKLNISVIGLTTDNGSNLVAAFKQIEEDAKKRKTNFTLLRFACAAHTAQLLIADLNRTNLTMIEISGIISSLLVWMRTKKVRKQLKKNNMNSPPLIQKTRWNSIFICCQYIINNYDSIINIIKSFNCTKWQSPIEFDSEIKAKILALHKALDPLYRFTNNVQKNFVSASDVYFHLNKLQIEMSHISDPYNFATDIFTNIFTRFSETCDSTIALLSFILTKEGRNWWRMQKESTDEEIRNLMNSRGTQPSNLLIWFNTQKKNISKKLDELSSYLNLNSDMVESSFNLWVTFTDRYNENPIDYWKSNIITVARDDDGKMIIFQDLANIAIRILTLPGTEAICERIFSQLKLIHNHLRNSLKNDILDSILTIKLKLIWEKNMKLIYDKDEEEEEEEDINEEEDNQNE